MLMLLSGCVRRPSGVLSDKEMVPLVVDMELAEAYLQTQPVLESQDEYRKRMMEGILRDHGVSREQFERTMGWYGHNIDAYYKMDAAVNRELARRRSKLAKSSMKDQDNNVRPASDLWPYKRSSVIAGNSGSNVLRFSLPGAEINPGNAVEWRVKLRNAADLTMVLGVEYENGTMSYLSRPVAGQLRPTMTVQTDTAQVVSRVFGHIFVKSKHSIPLWLDSIMLEMQPLDSTLYHRINSQRTYRPLKRKTAVKPAEDEKSSDTLSAATEEVAPPAPVSGAAPRSANVVVPPPRQRTRVPVKEARY